VPFFYLVCTATRLARFNVQTRIVDSRFFVGLPAPAAAASICSILFFAPDSGWWRAWRHDEIKTWVQMLVLVALLLIGTLMVSTFRYKSFKKLDLRKRWSYRAFVPLAAVVLVIAFQPRAFFLALALFYTLSGPVSHLWARLRRGRGEVPPPAPTSDEAPAEAP
jgi:CDP-diacylglycerol--serine O-phosphatidyltransferase